MSALAVAGSGAIAGCGGSGGDGSGGGDSDTDSGGSSGGSSEDLGERVPGVNMVYMAGLGDSTQVMEDSLGIAAENISERIGVPAEPVPKEFSTVLNDVYNDARNANFQPNTLTLNARRLDPTEILNLNAIWRAGANGQVSHTQLANCEYSRLLREQAEAGSEEERREIVNEALSVLSDEVAELSMFNRAVYGAYRTDQLDVGDPGNAGMMDTNSDALINSGVKGDNEKVMNVATSAVRTKTYMASTDATAVSLWNNLIHSPLIRHDRNWDLTATFATDWDVSDEFQTFEFDLREGATFHNGDEITAEDVKWTHEFLIDNYQSYDGVSQWPLESIEAVDDYTVRFNLSETSPAFLRQHLAVWGVLHSDTWIEGGAEENPENVDIDTVIGSGPYQVTNFQREQLLQVEPYEDHWNTPDGSMSMQVFQDQQSAYRAFQDGTVNIFVGISPGIADQIENQMTDVAEISTVQGFTSWSMNPQTNYGPTKFREFRMAVSQCLDRQQMNQVANYGNALAMEYSCGFSPTHPFYPENEDEVLTRIADSLEGSEERARQILSDAGWGWDDSGRLHYPPDADLEPLWPEGETPMEYPDKFPCVEELSQ